MQIASECGKAAHWLWVSVTAHRDIQLAGAYIYAGSVRMQDRKRAASSLALLGHLLLRSWRSDAGARTQSKLPIEIVAGDRQPSSHVCTQPQTHANQSGFKPDTNV